MKILLTVLLLLIAGCAPRPVSSEIEKAYNATCRVETEDSLGSGVLLNTGYVLTAAHVIDVNKNNMLDEGEEKVSVHFYGSIASNHSGTVIYMSSWLDSYDKDVAVIEVVAPPSNGVSLVSKDEYRVLGFGERIYTIGCSSGFSPRITDGRLDPLCQDDDMNETKRDRITADISRGNSGGGVFYGNSLIGIATANFLEERQMPWNMLIPVPGEEGMGLLHGSGTVTTVSAVPGWSEMVNARQIRNMLEDAHLSFVVDKRPNLVSVYLAVLLNLILLLVLLRSCCEVIWNITGKKMC